MKELTPCQHKHATFLVLCIAVATTGCMGGFPSVGTMAPFPPPMQLSRGPDFDSASRTHSAEAVPAASNSTDADAETEAAPVRATVRGQSPPWEAPNGNGLAPGTSDHWRYPMQASEVPITRGQNASEGAFNNGPSGNTYPGNSYPGATSSGTVYPPNSTYSPSDAGSVGGPADGRDGSGYGYGYGMPGTGTEFPGVMDGLQAGPPAVDFDIYADEARTGRFLFGAGVNSDLGVSGQITIDERNFDWRNPPTSWQDIVNGTAWRGGGQGFRLEAMPGSQVQRYLVSWTQPYFYLPGIADPLSLSLSGFYFDRRYFDWNEQRLGGRVGLGYRLRPDLSISTSIRAENVYIHDPRSQLGRVPELDAVLGDNALYSGRVSLTHDTRDTPFAATQGHLVELSFEEVFGSFDYPRTDLDYRQYFLVRERPDGSGRHTLSYSFRLGFSGSQTPIFENYFAGGFSTLRGFDFRGASPVSDPPELISLGGEFRFLGSVEYQMPLTADDMLKGVVFCDFGTVEKEIELHGENYRVAPGVGLRIAIPAMGPAPLALDLAFPVAKSEYDDVQNFSFFLGFTR